MLENLTPQLFLDVNKPKYDGTVHLDRYIVGTVKVIDCHHGGC
jgi:hypothetical protein